MYEAGLAAGLTDAAARVMAAQAALESNYGSAAPGNNFFGIKAGKSWNGPTQRLWTHEVNADGATVRVKQTFRAYDSPEAGIADRVSFMADKFPEFNAANTVGDAYDALQNGRFGRYATAKRADYETALNYVNQTYLAGTPVPPGGIGPSTGVASELDVGDGTINYAPHLDDAGNYVGSPNRLRTNTYPKSVTSAQNAAYGVGETGLGALSDPRTAALMDGPMFDPVGDGPSPIQLLTHHENEMGGLHFSTNVQTAAEVSTAAPVPMPGRPAALNPPPGQLDASGQAHAVPHEVATAHGEAGLTAGTLDASVHAVAVPHEVATASGSADLRAANPAAPLSDKVRVITVNPDGSVKYPESPDERQVAPPAMVSEDHPKSNKAAASAPTPMPGRPGSLDAQPAPAPEPAKQTIRVGKHDYTVGSTFEQGGFRYRVTPTGIEKSRIPTGAPTIMSDVINGIIKEKAAEAAPGVKKAVGDAAGWVKVKAAELDSNLQHVAAGLGHAVMVDAPKAISDAVTGAVRDKIKTAAGAAGNQIAKFGTGLGGLLSPLFHGAPASGLTVEHVGEQNGRPVLAVSGQAIISRAPPPAAVQFDAKVSRSLIPAITAQPTIKLPTTMNEALAGTNYAAAGAVLDQHFSKPDPIIDTIHDKQDSAQMKAQQPVKAPPVSTSIVKPQTGAKPVPAPAAPAAKPQQPVKADDVGHPSTWGDFTEALSVPLPAPAKLVPPAQRTVVQPPARNPSVVVTTPSATGVGSMHAAPGADVKGSHAAQPAPVAATTPQPTQPQVKSLPALQPVVEPHHTVVAQPTTQTAGAPVPIAAQNTQRAAAAAAPVYVDKATGAKLTPVTVSSYNPETQQWGTQTVYRPASNTPAPAPAPAPQQQSQPFNYDQYARDTFGNPNGGAHGGSLAGF